MSKAQYKIIKINRSNKTKLVELSQENPFRYSMYQYDEETGFYYLKSRYYNPDLGRFITRDGIDSINLYSYAGNNPVSFVDPNGQLFSLLIVYLSTLGMAPDTNFDLMLVSSDIHSAVRHTGGASLIKKGIRP